MVLIPRLPVLAALAVFLGCLGTTPPQRLPTATPIALHVQLETAGGEALSAPESIVRGLDALLIARNLQPVHAPGDVLGDARTSAERVDRLTKASTAPWLVLVEARARFFSQLSGRYRWEVELRTSIVARDRPDAIQASDLSLAAFLMFEHEGAREALTFVRRQLESDVAALLDRAIASHVATD